MNLKLHMENGKICCNGYEVSFPLNIDVVEKDWSSALFSAFVFNVGRRDLTKELGVHRNTIGRWLKTGVPEKYWRKLDYFAFEKGL